MHYRPVMLLLMVLATAEIVSIPALLRQKRIGRLSLADVMLPLAPAVMVVVGLLVFNQPAQVGYALLIYPVAVTCLSVVVLYAKVFVAGHSKASRAGLSTWILIGSCVLAGLLGATVRPWYE